MKNVLFVCTGNTCRSPMAAAIYKNMFPKCNVDSAGLFADGSAYSEKSAAVLAEIGITLSGFSKPVTKELIDFSDIIFCMNDSHKEMLISLGANPDRIKVLDIPDPYGGDISIYRLCRDAVKRILSYYSVSVWFAKKEDLEAIAKIENSAFAHPWSMDALTESMQNGTLFFIAKYGADVVGYMGLNVILDEGYVTNIAVLPEYQGIGIGSKILDTVIDYACRNKLSFVTLEVRKSNKTAIKLYESRGFKNVGERKNFYVMPNEDAYIYTRMMKNENSGN